MPFIRVVQAPTPEVDLKTTYDAIVVGSGAAGGMAAHVLTSHGMKVLLLEAGKKLDIEQGAEIDGVAVRPSAAREMPPDSSCALAERVQHSPAALCARLDLQARLLLRAGLGRQRLQQEHRRRREGSSLHRHQLRLGARALLGGKTNIWGRLALRLSDYDFKAKSHDGYGEDWPISYADIAPYYDKVDLYLGISGVKENLPHLPDSIFQRPIEADIRRSDTAQVSLQKMGRVLTPYRAGVTTDGLKHNKYRSRCFGRGACDRARGGCDIHAAFDSPTGSDLSGDGHRQPDAAHQLDRARE